MNNKIKFFLDYIFDSRLRKDIKSLKLAKKGYTFFAYQLAKKVGIYDALKKDYLTMMELSKKLQISNLLMLEALLDFLVGSNTLSITDGKYHIGKFVPEDFSKKEKNFIEKHYVKSQDWTIYLFKFAESALKNGRRTESTGFDDTYASKLWDEVMIGPLFSLRNIAVNKLLEDLPPHSIIVDFGCGSGSSMIEIAKKLDSQSKLIGVDISRQMLSIAKEKMAIGCPNFKNYNLIEADLTKNSMTEFEYDRAFCSLLLNHLTESEREIFIKNISLKLKRGGKVVVFQLVNNGKFDRVFSDWLLFVTPSHKGFPVYPSYLNLFHKNFNKVEILLGGAIIIATK